MEHIVIPMNEVLHLMVNPGDARIDSTNRTMLCTVDDKLHILVGNFTGIDTSEKLDEIIQRNL